MRILNERSAEFSWRCLPWNPWILGLIGACLLPWLGQTAPRELAADFGQPIGVIKALHGINKGPLAPGGLIDLTEPLRPLYLPTARMHDCHWPNPDVVDVHVVFPNFDADPTDPKSYDFSATDEYLLAVQKTGARIIYRLGESIEHTTRKRFVHPPADPEKWASICLGIIRHYNEGWARGHRFGIQYWEIWNEPENRPAMWSGTDEDYLRLYAITSRALRSRYPNLKIGGPAVGASGRLVAGAFEPTTFVSHFLEFCRRESLPLDFFSWHCYTDDPAEVGARARGIRQLLDNHGFKQAESHLNEWNYLPGNSWTPLGRSSTPEVRQRFYEDMADPAGAAFLVTSLLELQDASVNMANLFHGELGGFGLFNEHGVPQKNYYGLQAFSGLLDTPRRVSTLGSLSGRFAITAGLNSSNSEAGILLSNFTDDATTFQLQVLQLPWKQPTQVEIRLVNANQNFELGETMRLSNAGRIYLILPKPTVALVRLRPNLETRSRAAQSSPTPVDK